MESKFGSKLAKFGSNSEYVQLWDRPGPFTPRVKWWTKWNHDQPVHYKSTPNLLLASIFLTRISWSWTCVLWWAALPLYILIRKKLKWFFEPDISWRTCSAGVYDQYFSSVCSTASSQLTVAVTISAVWLNVQTGPAVLSDDSLSVLITRGSVPVIVRRIGWQPIIGSSAPLSVNLLSYNDPAGYRFRVIGTGSPDLIDNTISSRL